MDSSIIISLILGCASIVSSICFGVIPSIRKNKLQKLEEKVQRLLWDIKLFYEIEEELLTRLEGCGYKKGSLKPTIRKIVSDNNDGRVLSDEAKPSVYEKQIKR